MKSILSKWLLALLIGGSLSLAADVASAYYRDGYYWRDGYRVYHGGYYRGYYGYRGYGCRWVPGHWAGGFWRPAHRVCWTR